MHNENSESYGRLTFVSNINVTHITRYCCCPARVSNEYRVHLRVKGRQIPCTIYSGQTILHKDFFAS